MAFIINPCSIHDVLLSQCYVGLMLDNIIPALRQRLVRAGSVHYTFLYSNIVR